VASADELGEQLHETGLAQMRGEHVARQWRSARQQRCGEGQLGIERVLLSSHVQASRRPLRDEGEAGDRDRAQLGAAGQRTPQRPGRGLARRCVRAELARGRRDEAAEPAGEP
jgi:hypothetical protein